MPVSEKIRNRTENAVAAIKASGLSLNDKDDLIEMVTEARDATNGLGAEEKLQAVSSGLANLCFLFTRHLVEPEAGSWRSVLVACRREALWLGLGVCLLLVLRPQLGQLASAAVRAVLGSGGN